jgi:hypothetical protein
MKSRTQRVDAYQWGGLRKSKRPPPPKKEVRLDKVAHAYNPSYLGDGDGKDCGSREAWAKN